MIFAEIFRIDGNVTIPSPVFQGKPLDLNNQTVRRDLADMSSSLARSLLNEMEPEVSSSI